MRRFLAIGLLAVMAATGCSTNIAPDSSGQEIYEALCTRCHGADLAGGVGPAVGAGSDLAGQPDTYLIQTIKVGLGRMPSFRNTLTDEQINRVGEYIREQQESG